MYKASEFRNLVMLSEDLKFVYCYKSRCTSDMRYFFFLSPAKPYFPFGIGNKFVDPGQTLKWRCKAVARPKAIYAWYKNGQLLENGVDGIEVQENVLTLRNIDKDRDEGMYQCSATNVHGTTYSSGQLKVLCMYLCFQGMKRILLIQLR